MKIRFLRLATNLIMPCAFVGVGVAQPCRSIEAGDFLDSENWDCGCDPTQCDTAVVFHEMTIGADAWFSMAVLVIEQGGAVATTQRLVIEGKLENNDSISAQWLSLQGDDDVHNTGLIEASVLLLLKDSIFNDGELQGRDSLVLGWSRPLFNEGLVVCGYYYGLGWLSNYGALHADSSWSRSFYNTGLISVAWHLYGGGSFLNEGSIEAGSIDLVSGFDNYGEVKCFGLFTNGTLGGGRTPGFTMVPH